MTPAIQTGRIGDAAFTGSRVTGQPTRWFDPNAFSLPEVGTFGNVSRGALRGPGLGTVDLSVLKNTRLSERFTLQFRAEFFNLLNRANFGTPNPIVFGTFPTRAAGQPAPHVQRIGWPDHDDNHFVAADPGRAKTDLLDFTCRRRKDAILGLGMLYLRFQSAPVAQLVRAPA